MRYVVFSKPLSSTASSLGQTSYVNIPQGFRRVLVDASGPEEALRAAKVGGGCECFVVPEKYVKEFRTRQSIDIEAA